MDRLRAAIRNVPDFPKKGILFRDITTLLKEGVLFREAVDLFVDRYVTQRIDAVIGIESRGFLFGSALAYRLGCGVVPIRKAGKLPAATFETTYALEYGEDTIQIHRDALEPNARVVLIDDLLATGGTMRGAIDLVKKFENVKIIEVAFLIELSDLEGRKQFPDVNIYSALLY